MKTFGYVILLVVTASTCQPKETVPNSCRLDQVYYDYLDKSDPIHKTMMSATFQLLYDKQGRLITVEESGLVWTTTLSWNFTSHYLYDGQDRITEIQKLETGGLQPRETRKFFFYQDRWIKLIKLLVKNTDGSFVLEDSTVFNYNSSHQLTGQKVFRNSSATDSTEFLYGDNQTMNFYASVTNGRTIEYQYDGKKNPFFELNLMHQHFDWVRFSGFEVDYRTSNSPDVQNYYCQQLPGEISGSKYYYNAAQYPTDLILNCGNIYVTYQYIYSCH